MNRIFFPGIALMDPRRSSPETAVAGSRSVSASRVRNQNFCLESTKPWPDKNTILRSRCVEARRSQRSPSKTLSRVGGPMNLDWRASPEGLSTILICTSE